MEIILLNALLSYCILYRISFAAVTPGEQSKTCMSECIYAFGVMLGIAYVFFQFSYESAEFHVIKNILSISLSLYHSAHNCCCPLENCKNGFPSSRQPQVECLSWMSWFSPEVSSSLSSPFLQVFCSAFCF